MKTALMISNDKNNICYWGATYTEPAERLKTLRRAIPSQHSSTMSVNNKFIVHDRTRV